MEKNYRTDRHLNPVALTTSVAKSLGWKQGVDYEVGDPFQTESGSTLHTARLKVPEGMSALEFTKKKFDDAYASGADVFYTKSGQPRWTHTAVKKEDWKNMSDSQKLSTISKMYKNEGGSGSLSKPVTYGKEPNIIQKGISAIGNFLLPTASASDGKEEPLYAGGFKALDNVPMGSGGFVAKKAPQIDYNDINAVVSFIDANGGMDKKDVLAADIMVKRNGLSREDALRQVAKKKAYFMENPEKTLEGLSIKTDEEAPSKASELGRFGIPSQSIDFMGRPEALPKEQVDAAKSEIMALKGGWNEIAANIEKFNPVQKEAMIGILKDEYGKYAESDEKTKDLAASRIRGLISKMAPDTYERGRLEQSVFGITGPSSDNFIERAITTGGNVANTLMDAIGFNPAKGVLQAGEKLGTAESGWEAANALMQGIGTISTANPVGAAVTAGLNNLAKTDVGASIIRSAMAIPEKGAEILVSAMDVPEEQKGDAISLIRDIVIAGAARGAGGAVSGAKAGFSASPAASAGSKVASSLSTGLKQGAVEFGKGILDPFKANIPSSKSSAKSSKVLDDAASRVKLAAKNEKSISPTAKRIGEEGILDAAEGVSKLRELGVDLGKKNRENLAEEVASAKETVFSKFNKEAKDVPVQFNKAQLKSGVESIISKELKGGIDDATQAAIDDIVNQIDTNLTRGGKNVADMANVHKITSKLYDVIVKATDNKGILRTNAPIVLLAVKEALYKQLESVPGFSKYIDDYRNLSRVEDVARLMSDKFGTDIRNKSLSEIVPASWTGIMAGAAGTGNWGIASSAVLATLVSASRQLKKSPSNLFGDIKLVSDAIDKLGQGGADALRESMGIAKKPLLGQNAPDIKNDFLGLAGSNVGTKVSAPIEKPTGKAQNVDLSGFEPKATSATTQKPSPLASIPADQQFGGKGFLQSIGGKTATAKQPAATPVKKATAKPAAKAPAKKPVEAPKKPATAPKASSIVKKPVVAPKAKEVAKKAIPAKAQSVEEYVKGVKLSKEVSGQLKEFVNNLKEYDIKEQSDAIAKVAKIGAKELAGLLQHAEPRTGLYMALSEALAKKLKK